MTSSPSTISVIIPLYNGARFIAQALDSVFAQSLAPIEVIVVDYGSTDEGPAIVAAYASNRPLILLQQPHNGRAAARNFGVRHARGQLLALLDQDDVWYRDHLQQLSLPFARDHDGNMGLVYGNYDEITMDGHFRTRCVLAAGAGPHPRTSLEQCLVADLSVPSSATLLRHSGFTAVGGFDETLSGCEDEDLLVRLFVAGYRNDFINSPVTKWRLRELPASHLHSLSVSRTRYLRKLLLAFPDEPVLGRFYTRDLILPRFVPLAVANARKVLRQGDPASIEQCMDDIAFLDICLSSAPGEPSPRSEFLISAVIPLFNGAPFIREALQSVFDQSLQPDEVIVVDDGSTDTGAEIVRDMAKRYPIRLLKRENGGQSAARNMGVSHAHGDLIAFLDQDDAWYADHLAKLVEPFRADRSQNLGWSYSDLDEINEAGQMIVRGMLKERQKSHPKRDLAICLREDMFILPSASLISRRAFQKVGGFDERLSGYEDDDLFLRLFLAGFGNVFLPDSLSRWRIYQLSSSYSPRMAISRAIYATKLIQCFPDDDLIPRYYVADLIAPRFFRTMAVEFRKVTLSHAHAEQGAAFVNLTYITKHLRAGYRLPLRLLVLPLLRFPPLARFILRRRRMLVRLMNVALRIS